MATTQPVICMANGEMPMPTISLTMALAGLRERHSKCSNSFCWLNCHNCQVKTMTCASTVAIAAPLMPMCRGQMKIGSRMMLSTTVTMVAIIASRGLLAERKAAFRPR